MLYISSPVNYYKLDKEGNRIPADHIPAEAFKGLDEVALAMSKINSLRCLDGRIKARANAELMCEYYEILGRALR